MKALGRPTVVRSRIKVLIITRILKKTKKTFKDVKIKPESDPDLELKSFIYVIRNFDLDDSKSSYFIGFLNSRNSVKDFETEDDYLAAFNKSKKPLKHLPNKLDLLLYNTGTTNYIVNDRKWFKDNYIFNRG